MVFNKYLPFALLFFFLNTTGLPHGLTLMTLLSPLLYVWVIYKQQKEPLWPFLLLLLPFVVMHLINGVDIFVYIQSLLNIIAVYIFARAFYICAQEITDWNKIIYPLLTVVIILCIIAIPLYFTKWYWLMWIDQYLTEGFDSFRRLRLFTYEASYFAVLFTPIFFYCFLQIILKQNKYPIGALIPMLLLPLVLSFSMGVIACLAVCISLMFLLYPMSLLKRKTVVNSLITFFSVIIFALAFMIIFFPDNPLFVRVENILTGHDSSGKGRTSDAFLLVNKMIRLKSECWGIGFGQIKILGEDIVRNYYHYDENYAITIPNASAETLAVTGWIGWTIRLVIQVFLFFFTKVWRNYYRFLLFTFIFIYQFTGSFITSQIEYVIWIMAFSNIFPGFDVFKPAFDRATIKTLKNE